VIPPTIAVEIAAPDGESPHLSVLLEACSRAAPGPCAKAGEPSEGVAPTAAIVTWEAGGHLRARVEVGTRAGGKPTWSTRTLSFRAEDAEVERWRTVGLVIATLASAGGDPEPTGAAAVPPAAAAAKPPSAGPAPAPVADGGSAPWPWIWIDGTLVAGPATDDGVWRVGGSLRGEIAARSVPALALLSLRYLARPADDAGVAVQWASGSVGFGVHVAPWGGELRLQGRLEVAAELVAASVGDPGTGETDSGSRWVAAARAGVDAVYMLGPSLGVLAGVDATIAQSGTLIRLRGDRALRALPFTMSPSLGVRVALP
jgi:hypothetical protein